MDVFLLVVCAGLVVAGFAMIVTSFTVVSREPTELTQAQVVIDGKHHLGGRRSFHVRVRECRKGRLVRGVLIIIVAMIAGVATVSWSLEHMTFDLKPRFLGC
jgi:hypothetical protein